MNRQFQGTWKSGTPSLDVLTLIEGHFTADGKRGRWNATEREIWLLNSDGKTGTKWVFTFDAPDVLTLHDPEDFTYMGHGEYMYFQMTPPKIKIAFRQVKDNKS